MPAALKPDSCPATPAPLPADDPLADRAVCTYESTFGLKDDEKVDAYLQLSNDLQHEGRLPEALAVLQAVVAKKADHTAAWYLLGLAYLRMERASEACVAFMRAQRLGDHSFQCHCGLAEALMELGRRAEAAVHLSVAVELDPSAHEAYCRLGICLGQLGRCEDSVAALERAVALAPDRTDYHRRLAFTYDNMGIRDQAIRCFNRAVELERKGARAAGGAAR